MTVTLTPDWGPYSGPVDAGQCLSKFVDQNCDPATGIVWASNGNMYALRAPKRDGEGIGVVVTFQWNKPPPPAPAQAGFWGRVVKFLEDGFEAAGRSQMLEAESYRQMGLAMEQVVPRMLSSHRSDGLGVGLDFFAVVLSLALLPTGIGVLAGVALVASGALLVMDGDAYALEMAGNDDDAEQWKSDTEYLRIAATILTLPDLAYGGYKAVKEIVEIREARALAGERALRADELAAKTESAARAERFKKVAEHARKRAESSMEKSNAGWNLR